MILLNKRASHLAAGYGTICRAEATLRDRWRGPLMAGYARRRATYDAAHARHRQQMAALKPWLAIALVIAGILFILGLALSWLLQGALPGLGPVVAFSGVVIGLGMIAIWTRKAVGASPRRP